MEMTKPTTETPATPPQVNDVTAPVNAPAASAAPATDTPDSQPITAPKDDTVAAPPAADDAKAEEPVVTTPAKPVTPKKHGSGAAIFAAVIVVLALGAMFTYAYLQSQ
jgi:uncharacterized protein HemX